MMCTAFHPLTWIFVWIVDRNLARSYRLPYAIRICSVSPTLENYIQNLVDRRKQLIERRLKYQYFRLHSGAWGLSLARGV